MSKRALEQIFWMRSLQECPVERIVQLKPLIGLEAPMPRCLCVWACVFLFPFLLVDADQWGSAFAQQPSGRAVGVIPDASALRSEGRLPLALQQPVYMGDRIQTGPSGEAQIDFVDTTRLVVGPASSLLIDSSVMRNRKTMSSFVVSALRGTFRFISGTSPKPAYAIRTPTATIGVRGTEFDFAVLPDGGTEFVLFKGQAQVCDRSGNCAVVRGACNAISIPRSGPIRPLVDREDRNARLRAYFPYIRARNASLRPEFRTDVRTCGNIAASGCRPGCEGLCRTGSLCACSCSAERSSSSAIPARSVASGATIQAGPCPSGPPPHLPHLLRRRRLRSPPKSTSRQPPRQGLVVQGMTVTGRVIKEARTVTGAKMAMEEETGTGEETVTEETMAAVGEAVTEERVVTAASKVAGVTEEAGEAGAMTVMVATIAPEIVALGMADDAAREMQDGITTMRLEAVGVRAKETEKGEAAVDELGAAGAWQASEISSAHAGTGHRADTWLEPRPGLHRSADCGSVRIEARARTGF